MNGSSASTYTERLARFSASTRVDDLSSATLHATKRLILDTLGCAVAGAGAESTLAIARVLARFGGVEESTVVGSGQRLPAPLAAYINAYAANALDADDDLHYKAHVAAAAIPPALAMAERQARSGLDLIAATAIGYDVAARVGMSLRGLSIDDEGELRFAPVTGYSWCGFAAAVSSGWLLDLDQDQMRDAIGITAHTIPLPSSTQHSEGPGRAMTKYAMYGTMTEAGILAALLAQEGFTGLPGVLDGEKGVWRPLGSLDCDFDAMTDRLGERWYIEETSFKIYPACRFTNAASDLYLSLAAEHDLRPDEVERVHVELIGPALQKHVGDPSYLTLVDGQFSMAYVMAVTALGVVPGLKWHLPETRNRADVRGFADKVTCSLEPTASLITAQDMAKFGHATRLPATVAIHARGQIFQARAEYARGDVYTTETALTDADLEAKFRDFCADLLPAPKISEAIDRVWTLEAQSDVGGLARALCPT